MAHFILKEFLTTAVVIETEVGQIVHVGVNFAVVVEHEVKVEEQSLELDDLIKGEGAKYVLDPVELND